MRYLSTILLFILAVALCAFALLHKSESYSKGIEYLGSKKKIGGFLFNIRDIKKAKQIILSDSKGNTATFRYEGNLWSMKSPREDRADVRMIGTLLHFTSMMKVRDVVSSKGTKLNEYGLKDGRIRVQILGDNDKNLCDYLIGRTTAWSLKKDAQEGHTPTLFIQLGSKRQKENIYVCSENSASNIHQLFANEFLLFRDHHPFYFNPKSLKTISLQYKGNEVLLSKENPLSSWKIIKPLELPVDSKAFEALLKRMLNLRATKIADRVSVTLPTGGNGTSQQQEISIQDFNSETQANLKIYPPQKKEDPEVLATVSDRPDSIFFLPLIESASSTGQLTLNHLLLGVNDLRSKTLCSIRRGEIRTIVIKPENMSSLLLERKKHTPWRIFHSNKWKQANEASMANLLSALTEDKIQKFVTDSATDLTPYGLNKPFLHIGFASSKGEKLRLAFGKKYGKKEIYAHLAGSPNVWQINTETLSKINTYPWQWQSADLLSLPKIDIRSINISRRGKKILKLDYNFFSDEWKAILGNDEMTHKLNPYRANNLIKIIQSLQTTKWLGPFHPHAKESLKKPDTLIHIKISSSDSQNGEEKIVTKTLSISHTKGSLICFGKLSTEPASFSQEKENSYFLLNPETVSKLYINLFE